MCRRRGCAAGGLHLRGSEYNARVHSSTHESPDARLSHVHPDHPILWVDPRTLADAFLWTESRVVTAVGTISLEGHDYEVAPELARRKITVHYDPCDLSQVTVEWDGRGYGTATPLGQLPQHSRHVRAPEPTPAAEAPAPERTRFHDLLQRHDEQQRFETAEGWGRSPCGPFTSAEGRTHEFHRPGAGGRPGPDRAPAGRAGR